LSSENIDILEKNNVILPAAARMVFGRRPNSVNKLSSLAGLYFYGLAALDTASASVNMINGGIYQYAVFDVNGPAPESRRSSNPTGLNLEILFQ
jgi:hypothetical protein